MRSLMTITVPADDISLLSIEEMRKAAGISTNASDADLMEMEADNAATITTACNIAPGAGYPPTLRREMVTETIYQVYGDRLILSRRHDVTIYSVVEDGETLPDTAYLVDPESARLTRLRDDNPVCWSAKKLVVVYDAGFVVVPGDLKKAASDFLRSSWMESQRDPLVKSERIKIDDVEETERQFWVGPVPGQSNSDTVPDFVMQKLTRFRNYVV